MIEIKSRKDVHNFVTSYFDLLEACKRVLKRLEVSSTHKTCIDTLQQAISKAEGGEK